MKKIIIALISIIIVFFIVFLVSRCNRDEKIIKKNLRILELTVSKSKDDNNLALIAKTQKIQSFFTNDCRVAIEHELIPEIDGLNELITVFQQLYRSVDEVKVNCYDISVILLEKRMTAKINMTAKATGSDPQGGGRVTEAREVKMLWKKIDGKWKIVEAKAVKTLH